MTNATAPVRKVRVTAQSVAFLALTEGMAGVTRLHNAPGSEIASATFDSAIDLLASQPEVAASLAAIRSELYGDGEPGARGRPAAEFGDHRVYKAQQVNDGDCFIRLPVNLLRVGKGEGVKVLFEDGVFTVTRA